jgi:hypothetical protein
MNVRSGKTTHSQDLDPQLEAVMALLDLFKAERMVYLVATSVSFVILLVSAGYVLAKTKADPPTLVMIFGSTGLIGYSANRLLRMWEQALSFCRPIQERQSNEAGEK